MNPGCERSCPYLTSQAARVETSTFAADMSSTFGGIGIMYLVRQFRARNCDGPLLPMAGSEGVTYCNTLGRSLQADGQDARQLVERGRLPIEERMRARDPQRWQELYERRVQLSREELAKHAEIIEGDQYTADEIQLVRGLSEEMIDGMYGSDFILMARDIDTQSSDAARGQLQQLRRIVENADRVFANEQQGMSRQQAIEAVVVQEDPNIRYLTGILLRVELDSGGLPPSDTP